jgi:pyridoxal 5'-phosphate synthase pdxS subunit
MSKNPTKPVAKTTKDSKGTFTVKSDLAKMLKGGVIMDVTNAEQARIAEKAGAVAVMALERVPADIRAQGGVARMSDPKLIKEIQAAVSIPVMAKIRIGHIAEAQILQALKVDFIDESEVLTPADTRHVNKWDYAVPFVCGATGLGEALRRIQEGAAMIRTKGEAGTGDVIEAVRHMRKILGEINGLKKMNETQLKKYATTERLDLSLLKKVRLEGKLPVVNFAAGGIATPADASFLMQIGAEGVFVGSGIFKSKNPAKRARAIVLAVMNYNDPAKLAEASEDLEEPMFGIQANQVETRLQERGKNL